MLSAAVIQGPRLSVPLSLLRPTQAAVGMRSVANKRRKLEKHVGREKKFDRFLDRRPIPSVRGPADRLYMVDHHHLGLALWQADVEMAYVTIIEDLSQLPMALFWRRMEAGGWLHPFDGAGRRIAPSKLPMKLTGLDHDCFRDLAWSVREAGGFRKTRTPFAEFAWADFYRTRLDEGLILRDYDQAVRRAMKLSRSRDAHGLPGYTGRGHAP
jgi:hypothetical protein